MFFQKKTLLFSFLVLFFWIMGFGIFAYKTQTIKEGFLAKRAVVFTGAKNRLTTACDLLRDGKISDLFISGVNKNVTKETLQKYYAFCKNNKVTLGYQARNTKENAKETLDWIKSNKIKEILLITDSEHMLRCLFEMEQRTSIKIVPYPIRSKNLRFKKLFLEYNKFISSVVFSDTENLSKILRFFSNR
jgi:uncharacterized SAM-binding protein YcdF (DUF218 family)